MKLLKPFLPALICISLVIALAVFIGGTFAFLAAQAFLEIHANNGSIVAYLGVIAGVMIFSCIAYQLIQGGFCHFAKKKKAASSTFDPNIKFLIGVVVYEGLKIFLEKRKK